MIKIALYVSNHGFGHASRISALAEELCNIGVFCHIIYMRNPFLFGNLNPTLSKMHQRALDTGVKHGQNLCSDLIATKQAILDLLSRRNDLIATELKFIREEKIDLIISDAPYLVSDIAAYASIPVYCVTNFEWHFIYSDLFAKDLSMKPVTNLIWALYKRMDACFRLPLSNESSVGAFSQTRACGLLARRKASYTKLRKNQGWDSKTRILLVMFGGEGAMEIDYEALCKGFNGIVISTSEGVKAKNHYRVNMEDDFLDLLYNADIVLCKPGYSTLAEAMQFGKFILYCPRKNYPEETALIEGMENYPNRLELRSLKMNPRQWKALFASLNPVHINDKQWDNKNSEIAGKILAEFLPGSQEKLLSVFDLGTNNLNYTLYNLSRNTIIHKSHVITGMGRGYKGNTINSYRISMAKKALRSILDIDAALETEKVMIATGISRIAENAKVIKDWVEHNYSINYQLITAKQEINYVYHAAKKWGSGEEAIAIDIGGASTEVVYLDRYRKEQGTSLALGLLTLLNSCGEDINMAKLLIGNQLNKLLITHAQAIVGVGLTYSYLAAVVFGNANPDPDIFDGAVIPKSKLQTIASDLDKGITEPYLPYLSEKNYLPILRLNILFNISLLDKFGLSEIIVCSDGISVGYAKARFRQKTQKGR